MNRNHPIPEVSDHSETCDCDCLMAGDLVIGAISYLMLAYAQYTRSDALTVMPDGTEWGCPPSVTWAPSGDQATNIWTAINLLKSEAEDNLGSSKHG